MYGPNMPEGGGAIIAVILFAGIISICCATGWLAWEIVNALIDRWGHQP